jgi:ABC-type sugar transport system ATPase subunit
MTVGENLGFALAVRKAPKAEIGASVGELAEQLGLAPLLARRAVGLSGGEAQRVALGRALALRPSVLLLDEPLNAVDEETHKHLVALLARLKNERSVTILHVTHNPAEADLLADTTLDLEDGRVTPREKG